MNLESSAALTQSRGTSSEVLYHHATQSLVSLEGPILDLGCGQGTLLRKLRAAGARELTGCDGFAHENGLSSDGIQFVQADLNERLPFAGESFAAVTAIEVIEHLENPRHFMREIARILKPGGTAIVSTPNNESLTSTLSLVVRGQFSAFADANYPAHITPVLRIDLLRIFNETGFDRTEVTWTNSGRMPKLNVQWQGISRRLFRGRLFSDNYLVRGIRPRAT